MSSDTICEVMRWSFRHPHRTALQQSSQQNKGIRAQTQLGMLAYSNHILSRGRIIQL